jgi:hypothetical protein
MNNSRSISPVSLGLTLLGFAGIIASWFVGGLDRFSANWAIWSIMLLSIGLGAMFIVAIEHLTRAKWSIVIRRIPERISGILPYLLPLFILGTYFGLQYLFPWASDAFKEEALHNTHMHSKEIWYSTPFFLGRMVFCFVIWIAAWKFLTGGSIKQDSTKDARFSLHAKRFSAPFMWLFAISLTLIAIDWLMGMSPMWYSTIFGVYFFAGIFLSGLSMTVLWILTLQKQGRLKEIRPDHLYSLGGFMFAFTVFWAYIAFSQFMLIWYANLPEEIVWFSSRLSDGWYPITITLAVVRFVIPFFALLSRDAKTNVSKLRWVAILILAGHALDLYWIVFPELGHGVLFGWQEIAFAIGFSGLGWILIALNMNKGEDLPVGDPNLETGLNYHL